MTHPRSQSLRTRPAGLGLAELMVSLAICSMLLSAVAMAFHSTTQAVEVNDRFFRASQSARVAMTQMLSAVRTSEGSQVGTPAQQSKNFIDNAANLDIITADGQHLSYVFDSTGRTLTLVLKQPDGSTSEHRLARDVASARFDGRIETHPDTGQRRLVNVSIALIVEVEGQKLLLNSSATPRRERIY